MDLGDSYRADAGRLERDGDALMYEEGGAKSPDSGSPLPKMVRQAVDESRSMDRDSTPDSMPEVARELTMLRGAFGGVQRRAAELLAGLGPVLKTPPADLANKVANSPRGKGGPEVRTEVGTALRDLAWEMGELEELLGQMRGHLAV